MSRDRLWAEVRQIVAPFAETSPDEIHEGQQLIADLGCDSLDIIEISMEIEEQFDVCVPDELFERVSTAGDILVELMPLLGSSG